MAKLPEIIAIHRTDAAYPQMLNGYRAAPDTLYALGDLSLLNQKSVAIIGSRAATEVSINRTYEIARFFAEHGWCIVSGLAEGCDTAAHLGALSVSGKTIAVLPCPIEKRRTHPIAERIVKQGGLLLSEYPEGTPYSVAHYEQRDYIQAALSVATIPVQGGIKSGTRYASWKSLDLGRLTVVPLPDAGDVARHPDQYGLLKALLDDPRITMMEYSDDGMKMLLQILESRWRVYAERNKA